MMFRTPDQQQPELSALTVCTFGDPVLRQRAVAISEVTAEIRRLAARMVVTMFENDPPGIGLAAPQVGVGVRLITLATQAPGEEQPPNASPGERLLGPMMPVVLVNPEILSHSAATDVCNEGCLSIPEVSGDVERPSSIVLRARRLDGTPLQVECGGLLARCIQHEIDHLDGVLFVDRVDEAEAGPLRGPLRQLEKRTRRQLKKQRRG